MAAAAVSTSSSSSRGQQGGRGPPPALAILTMYILLGSGIAFLSGEPGTLPEAMSNELAPAVIVTCIFLTYYSLWDCMAVGKAKQDFQSYADKSYKEYNQLPVPEQVYLAQRVQTNQVEQMPAFFAGMFACALFVDGMVAATMGLAWSLLRMRYAHVYRHSIGMKHEQVMNRIAQYTIPAYFLVNSMLMAAGVNALRMIHTRYL